jgi:hypothetical protein
MTTMDEVAQALADGISNNTSAILKLIDIAESLAERVANLEKRLDAWEASSS